MNSSATKQTQAITVDADKTRAIAGAVFWLVLLAIVRPEVADAFLLLGPLVIVPLGLSRLKALSSQQSDCGIFYTGRVLQFPAAIVFGVGWMVESDVARSWCVIPWTVVTSLFAFSAVRIISRRRKMTVSEFLQCAALLFIAVGGGWALFYRIEYCAFDFPIGIVKLTAIHFHYAGFALPVIAAEVLNSESPDVSLPVGLSITLGIPLVALGITFSPVIELIGALVLALGCLRLSLAIFVVARQTDPGIAALLLRIAALSLLCSMLLAIVYAVGEYREIRWIGINFMVRSHGPLNAIGFSLCGLIALNTGRRRG